MTQHDPKWIPKRITKLTVGTFSAFGTFGTLKPLILKSQEYTMGPFLRFFLRPEMQNAVQNCQSELSELSELVKPLIFQLGHLGV